MKTLKDYIDFDRLSFEKIVNMIKMKEHFSLARYGDGEFNAMLGDGKGENCDGHTYFAGLGDELRETFLYEPDYFIAIHHSERNQERDLAFLVDNMMPEGRFCDNSVFHYPLKENRIEPLFEALRTRDVVIVGPMYLCHQNVLPEAKHFPIPGKDTYLYMDDIEEFITKENFLGKVVLFCASMCAPLLISRLHSMYPHGDVTLIDFGSTLDPFVGINSRSYHKHVNV